MLRTINLPAACRLLPLLCLPWLTPSPGYSQTTKVCLPIAQAAKIADSLSVLSVVRREAASWKLAADSAHAASLARGRAYQQLRGALLDQQLLTANETANADLWRHRARRRGLLSYLLLAGIGGSAYLLLTH